MTNDFKEITTEEILEYLPHRYPLLLVDKIVKIEKGKNAIGIKNVTFNEPHFMGHFPNRPIMPGVLIIESMAQTAGVLMYKSSDSIDPKDFLIYFISIDKVKFRKPVVPGDVLELHVEMIRQGNKRCTMHGVGKVNGQTVTEATFTAMLVDKNKNNDSK